MMIKLSDGCYVAHDQIAEVRINSYADSIVVTTKDGIGHSHAPEYKQSIYKALSELIEQINTAGEPK
jgi:hypothetical protein